MTSTDHTAQQCADLAAFRENVERAERAQLNFISMPASIGRAVLDVLAGQPAAPVAANDTLRAAILALQSAYQDEPGDDYANGFAAGHRNARWAAAELVSAAASEAAPVAATEQAIPEGYKLVPIEPTIEMMDGAFENISLSEAHTTYGVERHVWDFMLARAPQPHAAASVCRACNGVGTWIGHACNGVGTWIGQHDGYDDADCSACDGAGKVATPADAGAGLTDDLHTEIVGAVARGWCAPINAHKEMDSYLAHAIVLEVEQVLARLSTSAAPVTPPLQIRKETDELSLPELAEQFAAVEQLGCDYVLSAKVCGKLFRAMTTPPEGAPVTAEPVPIYQQRCGEVGSYWEDIGKSDYYDPVNDVRIVYTAPVSPQPAAQVPSSERDAIRELHEQAASVLSACRGYVQKRLDEGTRTGDPIILQAGNRVMEDLEDTIRALKGQPAAAHAAKTDEAHQGDFAKIVRASNGQQVLFFTEVDADDGNMLHCVANFPELQADMKLSGLPDEAFATALDKADVAMADKVIKQINDLGFGVDIAAHAAKEGARNEQS